MFLRGDDEQDGTDGKAGEADPEGPLLEVRVGLHADGDEVGRERDRRQRGDESHWPVSQSAAPPAPTIRSTGLMNELTHRAA